VQLFQYFQVGYFLFSLIGTGLFLFAFVNVMGWPQVRGRNLWMACLGIKTCVAIGYATMGLVNLLRLFGAPGMTFFPNELTQSVYFLLAMFGVAADGLLLAGVLSIGSVFHAIRRGSESSASF
jgi:hypothetical protein